MKNKFVSVVILNREGELEKVLGGFYTSELQSILKEALQLDLKCLPFISLKNNTYFNEEQAYEILNELDELKRRENHSEKLDYLEKMFNEQLKDKSFYIKFQPLK